MMHSLDGRVMWANLHLMFWLSLIPVSTAWIGQAHAASAPAAVYGVVLLMAGLAYIVLQKMLIAASVENASLAKAIGRDTKGRISLIAYLAAVGLAWLSPLVAQVIYAAAALLWLVPDRRIERRLTDGDY